MAKLPYAELVDEAEQAVKGVKDPELRRIAFQKVLEELLGGGGARPVTQARAKTRGVPNASRTKKASRGGPRTYIREMLDDGFFKKPKTITDVKAELENRGHHIPLTSLSGPLQQLCKGRELRRQRVDGKGNKKPFAYSVW